MKAIVLTHMVRGWRTRTYQDLPVNRLTLVNNIEALLKEARSGHPCTVAIGDGPIDLEEARRAAVWAAIALGCVFNGAGKE